METRGHQEIRLYLADKGLTGPKLAELAGLTPMQVAHLLKGRRRASLEVAVALEFATKGAVRPRDWVEPPKPGPRPHRRSH